MLPSKDFKIYQEINLFFMISGHTKFAPDSHFGTIKKKTIESNCFSILDLLCENGKVRKSASNNFEIVYKNPETSTKNFEWLDWKKFFRKKIFINQRYS